ncbi:MAG: DMT family transporter [Chloroflexi bacterium]|nr:DMT family transporter [Chloroflexota bacterium]
MTELALVLVLVSAVAHAGWNFIAKRASGGPVFNWLFDVLSVLVWAPLGVLQVVLQPPRLGTLEVIFIVGSAVLHLAYFLLLGQGYRRGDLSLVYPLARGAGPMLSTAAAVLLLGEHPTPLALMGAALIGLGVFVLVGDPRQLHSSTAGASVAFALLTSVVIAAYTLWDKQAVSTVGIPPILYFYLFTLTRALLLTPYALAKVATVKSEWRTHKKHALGIAALSPVAYILVLYALAVSPVSYVAPVREIGILLGALMGSRWLAEGNARQRLAGAAAMVLGVVALAVG